MQLLVDLAAGLLLLLQVALMLVRAARLRRQGAPQALVSADLTAGSVGLLITLGAALGAGAVAWRILGPAAFQPAPLLAAELAAGLAASWLAGAAYYRWLARPIRGWFTAEEEGSHGW